MIFCIPSFRRADKLKTVPYLQRCGIPASRIILSLQDEGDYEAYQRYAKDCTIIVNEASNVAQNRNNALSYVRSNFPGEKIVMLDDDVAWLRVMLKEGDRRTAEMRNLSGADILNFLEFFFAKAAENECQIWGGYPIDNPFFMRKKAQRNVLLIGSIMGFLDDSLYFDERFALKEDYELCLRIIRNGGGVLRFNYLAIAAEHYSVGGCYDHWANGERRVYSQLLQDMYPGLVTIKKDGEIKMR